MARRSSIPGWGDIPGGGGDEFWSGGDLDMSADGSRSMPAGAGVPGFGTTAGSKVQLTKDEAVAAAIAGLRGDVSILSDMKAQFDTLIGITAQNADHLGSMRRENAQQTQDMIQAINRIAEGVSRQNQGNANGLAGMPFQFGAGNSTAGYTTMNDLVSAIGGSAGGPAWGVGARSIKLNNNPASPYAYQVTSSGVTTGGNSPGSGLASRGNHPPVMQRGGGGGSGSITPYNTSSGPGPGKGPNLMASASQIGASLATGNYASAAIGIAKFAYGESTRQRAENERFQQVEGGSNFAGFGEREHQLGFRLNHLGLSSADDNAIFQGITGFGIRGGERNRLAGQVYHAKMNQGIGIGESMSALTAGAASASSALESVISGLQSVTSVAHDFGLNAVRVRQLYVQNLGAINSNTNISGTSAASLAASLTSSSAALGRTGLNISAANYVSGGNETALTMVAANAGISTKAADTMARNSPATYEALAGASVTQTLTRILGQNIADYIENALKQSSVPNFNDIGNKAIDMWGADSYTLYQTIIAQLPGVTGLTRNNVAEWVAQQYHQSGIHGTLKKAAIAATTRVNAQGQVIDTATGKKVAGASTTGFLGSTLDKGIQTTDSPNQVGISTRHKASASSALHGHPVTAAGVTDTIVGKVESGKSGFGKETAKDKAYNKSLQDYKGQIPQLEMLGRHFTNAGLKRVRIQFQTAAGLTDMSLEEAIQGFPAIVASGSPVIIAGAGSDNGKTLSDIFGGNVANSAQDQKDASAEAGSKSAAHAALEQGIKGTLRGGKGSAVLDANLKGKKSNYKAFDLTDYYNSQHQASGGSSTVTVTLSDNAQQLLKLVGPGSNSSATTGTPQPISTTGSRGGPSDPSN